VEIVEMALRGERGPRGQNWLTDGKIPRLNIGDFVRVNTGGPDVKVVGILWRKVVVEWPRPFGQKPEHRVFPRSCVEPVS
jgi:hypothetical protein